MGCRNEKTTYIKLGHSFHCSRCKQNAVYWVQNLFMPPAKDTILFGKIDCFLSLTLLISEWVRCKRRKPWFNFLICRCLRNSLLQAWEQNQGLTSILRRPLLIFTTFMLSFLQDLGSYSNCSLRIWSILALPSGIHYLCELPYTFTYISKTNFCLNVGIRLHLNLKNLRGSPLRLPSLL
jgi:hypothetical protein